MTTRTKIPSPSNKGAVDMYASRIMDMIHEDQTRGFAWGDKLPTDLTEFSQLHEHCDANAYIEDSGTPYPVDGTDDFSFANAVMDEVSRRMAAEASQSNTCPGCGAGYAGDVVFPHCQADSDRAAGDVDRGYLFTEDEYRIEAISE